MLWFSSSSRDSFVRRAACSLSLLAVLLGSSGVSAQLNNETSPTHQFKSVGTALLLLFRGLRKQMRRRVDNTRKEVDTGRNCNFKHG
jgi:hypothetical protein